MDYIQLKGHIWTWPIFTKIMKSTFRLLPVKALAWPWWRPLVLVFRSLALMCLMAIKTLLEMGKWLPASDWTRPGCGQDSEILCWNDLLVIYQSQKMPSMRQASCACRRFFWPVRLKKAWSQLIEEVTHAERIWSVFTWEPDLLYSLQSRLRGSTIVLEPEWFFTWWSGVSPFFYFF